MTTKAARIIKQALMAVIVLVAGATCGAAEHKNNPIYAQKLVMEFPAKYQDLITIGIHAKCPDGEWRIIAHTRTVAIGNATTGGDFEAMYTGVPDGPNFSEGSIYDCCVPLHDASGKTIGVFVTHTKPAPGKGPEEALRLTLMYRDLVAKEIPSVGKLFEKVTLPNLNPGSMK
jgi:hypothetical protein